MIQQLYMIDGVIYIVPSGLCWRWTQYMDI